MERRKEPRIDINQEVTITVLGEPDSPPFQATAVDMSGTGMRFISAHPVKYQAAVKVQTHELLLLGEVIRIEVCDRGHVVALKLQHSLDLLAVLHRLNQALRREGQTIDPLSQEELSVRK